MGLKRGMSLDLILAHKTAIADDIGHQNGGKPTLHDPSFAFRRPISRSGLCRLRNLPLGHSR